MPARYRNGNRSRRLARLLLLPAIAGPTVMAAADEISGYLGLTATVAEACETSVSSDSSGTADFGTMDFGEHRSLDNVLTLSSSEQAGSIGVTCSSGQSYTILLGGGNSGDTSDRHMVGTDNGEEVSYNLYTSSDYGTVWDDSIGLSGTGDGSETWHTVYGMVPAQTTPATDTYTDTVAVTITW
jgi:spore coat protein U-like protein